MARLLRCFQTIAGAYSLLIAFALGMAAPAAAQEIEFATQGPLQSDTGHLLMEWDAPGEVTLVLSQNPDFEGAEALYQGSNKAYFLSGLANGDYFVVLRNADGDQSAPVQLSVEHQSLDQAIWLTIIGAIITLATLAVIARGARS